MKLNFLRFTFNQPFRCTLVLLLVTTLSMTFISVMPVLAACDPNVSISRLPLAWDGSEPNDVVYILDMSADAHYLLLQSYASNLVSDDANTFADVFVYNRLTCQTTLASRASDGSQGNNHSFPQSISDDGRFVTFVSQASNFVTDDTNNVYDVFLRDFQSGQTTRVSLASAGTQLNNSSESDLSGLDEQSISADGRYVVFVNSANGVVPDDTNSRFDVFVRDRQLAQTIRVSVASDGSQANNASGVPGLLGDPMISANGRYVVFVSLATNLVASDTNNFCLPSSSNCADVFIHDLLTGQTRLVSTASDGTQANTSSSLGAISDDGRYVVFSSNSNNLVSGDSNNKTDVFIKDMATGQTTRASVASDNTQGNNDSTNPGISGNGRFVIFQSFSTNLVADDTNGYQDVFVFDRLTNQTVRLPLALGGGQPNQQTFLGLLSQTGAYVSIASEASNLVADDVNGHSDAFFFTRTASPPPTTLIVNSVNDANDGNCDLSHCSLREAIYAANEFSDANTINFQIPGGGVHTIQPITPLPLITSPVIIDATTQLGYAIGAPQIELNGAIVVTSYPLPFPPIDLVGINIVGTSNVTVRGLALNSWGYGGVGILNGSNNVIEGNFIGTNVAGTTAVPNLYGVIIYNGSNNRVGGTTPSQRNVISGNSDDGVNIGGQTSAQGVGNIVQGNYIGTNAAGTAALGNGDDGVKVEIADGTIIGGTAAGARNIIAASVHNGVILKGVGTVNSLVQGNYIGTNVTATVGLGNTQAGVRIEGAINNTIGGTIGGARNILSGNQYGIFVDSAATGNSLQGNFIGTDSTGTTGLAPQSAGVVLSGSNNTVGGTTPNARNIISSNVVGLGISGNGNTVQGNHIGTDVTGVQDLGNTAWGIEVVGTASNNTIGGTVLGAGNLIAHNGSNGIVLHGATVGTGNAILGNSVFSNGNLGIDLSLSLVSGGVTSNDLSDPDTGPNNLLSSEH